MRFVIPSKGRWDIIGERSLKFFPDAYVCVAEDEAERYAAVTKRLMVHPTSVVGMGPKRQWILDHVEDRVVVMADDDISMLYEKTGVSNRRVTDPEEVMAIVERTAIAAEDAGCGLFGYAQGARPMLYNPTKPIVLNTWVGNVVGVIGRELKYDLNLRLRAEDIDLSLQSFIRHRIIWCDLRYFFAAALWRLHGGNCFQRSKERHEAEAAYAVKKWGGGRYLYAAKSRGADGKDLLKVRVER